jgi:hypothetical protein
MPKTPRELELHKSRMKPGLKILGDQQPSLDF